MGLVIALFVILYMMRLKYWKLIFWFALAGLLPTILINIYFWSVGKLSDFWVNYFWNYFYYSYSTQFQSMPVSERFGIRKILTFILNSYHSKIYFSVLFVIICIMLPFWIKNKRNTFDKNLFGFSAITLVASFYATLQAGNNFDHYVLYLFIPLLLMAGVLLGGVGIKLQRIIVMGTLLLIALQGVINIYYRYPLHSSASAERDQKIVNEIQKYSTVNQSIVVWGWVDRLYYLSNRATGYRLPHSHNLFLKSELYDYRVNNFIYDMEANKPELVIDAMIPNYSMKSEIGTRFDEYPKVSKYIHAHYRFLSEIDGVKFYKRKVF